MPTVLAAAKDSGNFLVSPAVGPDDLDAARVRGHAAHPAQVRLPARSARRSTSASARSRSRSTRPSERARRPTRCWPTTASGSRRHARRRTRSSPGPRKAGEVAKRRVAGRGEDAARGAARADQARRRGRDAPRDPGDPPRGRRPDGARDREGDAQDARRRRPAAPRRGGARRARLQRLVRRAEPELAPWRRSPRSTRARCSRSPGSRASSTSCASSSASSPTRSNDNRDLRVFFFSPYFSTEEKKDGLHARARRRRPGDRELPRDC